MQSTLDENLLQTDQIIYGGFWPRLGAAFIDGLVLVPVTALMFYNNMALKSTPLAVIIPLLYPIYKIALETRYGATLGKMALKLRVVNLEFQPASFNEVLLRNIFQIISAFVSAVAMIMLFGQPGFAEATGFVEISTFQSTHSNPIFNYAPALLVLVDGIFLLTDPQKRALHDRIGKTYVIKVAE